MRGDIADLLRQHRLRVTPQRRAILQAFQGSDEEHLSADEVLARASATVPEISRGTVYATLAELTELGLLMSVGQAEPVRYELSSDPHDHFRCRLCLRLFDIEFGGREMGQRPLPGYAVENVVVRVDGVCRECRDFDRGLHEGADAVRRDRLLSAEEIRSLACARQLSPLGPLALAASASGIVRIAFEEHADFDALVKRAAGRGGETAARERVNRLAGQLDGYFSGSRAALTDAVDLRTLARQRADALRAVRRIPYAEPLSYSRLGADIEPFDCGQTLGANPVPLLIACHRVTCGTARPDAYVGGPERRHFLQGLEAGSQTG